MDVDVYTRGLADLIQEIDQDKIVEIADIIGGGEIVYLIGNGGSASNAEHAANDFMKASGIRAVALTASAPLTAYANDVSYADAFARQLVIMADIGDVLIAISVSGNSQNIAEAIFTVTGYSNSIPVILLTGPERRENAEMRKATTICLSVNDKDYGMVETVHQAIFHLLADILKEGNDGRE